MTARTPKLFVSYRREESAGHAGRLYDAIAERFGASNVFMDVAMAPGIDFVKQINEAVGGCHVLIVVIGPTWATFPDADGTPRVADPEDFVRLEVETALRRSDVTVIPVLVGGARMPDRRDLPEGLRPLSHRNALELSDGRWRYDTGRLVSTLDELLAGITGVHEAVSELPATPSEPTGTSTPGRRVLEGVIVAVAAGTVARALVVASDIGLKEGEAGGDGARIATSLLRRGVTWAAVGAALAIWLITTVGVPYRIPPRAVFGLIVGLLAGLMGGVISSVPVELLGLPQSDPWISVIEVASLGATGAVLGGLVGASWLPRRTGTGFAAGLVGGVLSQLIINQLELGNGLKVALQAALITTAAISLLAALQARAKTNTETGALGASPGRDTEGRRFARGDD